MKILFIYPILSPGIQIKRYQTGLGSISAVLKASGHRTHLYAPYTYEQRVISDKIDNFKPDLIGFSLTSNFVQLAFRIIDYINLHYRIPVIIGGIHPTVAPLESISKQGVMAVARGESEEAMLEFVCALEQGRDYSKVKNFWFKNGNEIIKNPPRPLINDLDKLPFPDRKLFNYQMLLNDYPQLEIMAGRGCPYKCSYCVNPFLKKFSENKGPLVRLRSVDNVLKEIGEIFRAYTRIDNILFQDDTFTLDRAWLKEFSDKYKRQFKIPFWCNTRIEAIDGEKVNCLKQAGCIQINVGIESGNYHIRKSVLKRELTDSQIIEACSLIKKQGIKLASFNMLGVPYETIGSIKETIELNRKIQPDSIFCSIFYPFPGTELYDLCKKNKWISKREVSSFYESVSVLDLPTISSKQVSYYYSIFKGLVFYPGLSGFIKLAARIRIGKTHNLYQFFQDGIWVLTRFISINLPFRFKSLIKLGIAKIRQTLQ